MVTAIILSIKKTLKEFNTFILEVSNYKGKSFIPFVIFCDIHFILNAECHTYHYAIIISIGKLIGDTLGSFD